MTDTIVSQIVAPAVIPLSIAAFLLVICGIFYWAAVDHKAMKKRKLYAQNWTQESRTK